MEIRLPTHTSLCMRTALADGGVILGKAILSAEPVFQKADCRRLVGSKTVGSR